MADVPVALVSGAATVAAIATDDVGGVDFQIVKLDLGTAGSSIPVIAGVRDPELSISIVGASGALFNVAASVRGNVAASVAGTVDVSARQIDVSSRQIDVSAHGIIDVSSRQIDVSAHGLVQASGLGTFDVSARQIDVSAHGLVVASVQGNVAASVAGTVDVSARQIDVSSRQIDVSAHGVVTAAGHVLVSGDGSFVVVGNVASDAADAGNPVKIGGIVVVSANPTSAAASDRVNASFDKVGRQVVVNQQPRELVVQAFVTVESANRTILASGGAAIFQDITHLSLTNAAATAVTVYVFQTSAGTPVMAFNLAAGGGVVNLFQPPWKQTTADKVWSLQSTSAATGFVYANVQAVLNT